MLTIIIPIQRPFSLNVGSHWYTCIKLISALRPTEKNNITMSINYNSIHCSHSGQFQQSYRTMTIERGSTTAN